MRRGRLLARLCGVMLLTLLAACAHRWPAGLDVDDSITAVGQSSRVRFIVLHYTHSAREKALATLSRGPVSAHYLLTDTDPVKVYALVPESRSAWHAGLSNWRGHTYVNNASIGIEIVNDGKRPYTEAQIQALILLVRDLALRHDVQPENIVGHSDIAPQRKIDPGAHFPWERLAAHGLGRWYDPAAVRVHTARFLQDGVPDAAWFQAQLARVGYEVPASGLFDAATTRVIAALQMHYRPARADGLPDVETAAILAALE